MSTWKVPNLHDSLTPMFSIFKFAFSDQEIDYGHIVTFGRTVGKEKIEKKG